MKVLFVSRQNTARSILAEASLNALSKGRFHALSCGSPQHLGTAFHPMALQALRKAGLAPPAGPCKSWDAVARGVHRLDFVITLSADVEGQEPPWPGQPVTALWAYPDVAMATDRGSGVPEAMVQTLHSLRRRLELFTSLPMRGDRAELRWDLRDLGFLA